MKPRFERPEPAKTGPLFPGAMSARLWTVVKIRSLRHPIDKAEGFRAGGIFSDECAEPVIAKVSRR